MFVEVCKRLEKMDPEYTYKYFPIHKTWTWEQVSNEGDEGPEKTGKGEGGG